LSRPRLILLVLLRLAALSALALFLFRPVILVPPAATRGAVVPVLVDVSRSMRLTDADGGSRIDQAAAIVKSQLLPALSGQFDVQVQQVGDAVGTADVNALKADARRSDLAGAIASVRERYRGQAVAGLVLLSDGGDTSQQAPSAAASQGSPVFAIGVGSPEGPPDREISGATIGDPKLDQATVDLHVSAMSSGYGREPFQLRLLANGAVVETRRIVPQADAAPIDELFTVAPDPLTPTVFTAEIPAADGEAVVENNSRSVLVSPAGRHRRILVLEGAPAFEHSFLKRALALDPGLEIDSVTRKGKNEAGQPTFFVQAAAGRGASLTSGFPATREELFAYDAIIVANVEADFFTRAQLAMASDFVSERGGGLLVMGGRSFQQQGLNGTPLEDALPVELNDRRGVVRTALGGSAMPANKLVLTPEGETHPVMRLGDTPDQTRRIWAGLPALASTSPVGAPRPGATVLAVAAAAGGVSPLIAVQRFGQGRSMVFAGEASWRWKMMVASTDRSYEMFWRHALRWLAGAAPDPVAITVPDAPESGDSLAIDIDARDSEFAPVRDASVDAALTPPGGTAEPLAVKRGDPAGARFTATFRPERAGLYRVDADASRGGQPLGSAQRWMYVDGTDREFADPRLNEALLRRLAAASGGQYVRAADASQIVSLIKKGLPQGGAPEHRDLWHEPWVFVSLIALLAAEWTLRRRWGLR
jgi:uncharacterized membrane protein